MTKQHPIWLAGAAQVEEADGPRLVEAWASPRRALTLREASGEPAGRRPSPHVSTWPHACEQLDSMKAGLVAH